MTSAGQSRRSRLRQLWDEGGHAIGGWSVLGSPFAAEVVAAQRLDYLVIDCQHGLVGYDRMVDVLGVVTKMKPVPLVRVPSGEAAWIGQALDAGAEGVIVPLVNSQVEAAAAAAACRFPPLGVRSFGPTRASRHLGYDPDRMNEGVICLVMIETTAGLEALDAICSTPGVDGVYVGPTDLGIGLGIKPAAGPLHPDLRSAVLRIRDACVGHGIVPAIHALDGERALEFTKEGFHMVTATSDMEALRSGVAREVATARSGLTAPSS